MQTSKNAPFLYNMVALESKRINESQDCAVGAIAIACGKDYTEVHTDLGILGRRHRKATRIDQIWNVASKYGEIKDVTAQYPYVRTAISAKRLPVEKSFIVLTTDHAFAVVEGEVQDWSNGRRLRVKRIWEVSNEATIARKKAMVDNLLGDIFEEEETDVDSVIDSFIDELDF